MATVRSGPPEPLVIVRRVSDAYAAASVTYMQREPIDLERARAQHQSFIGALETSGCRVVVLPADRRFPDSCFVEDTAVVLGGTAVITRMGAATRQGEQAAVADCLGQWMELIRMSPPAQLEGGDVLTIDKTILVGESGRTNRAGVEWLRDVASARGYHVASVPVRGALHLKTVVTSVAPSVLIAAPSIRAELEPYRGDRTVIELPEECAYAANVLRLRGTVLVPAGFPAASRAVERQGFQVKEIDLSEFRKRDGGLTCLAIVLD